MALAELIGSFIIFLSIVYVYYKYVIFNFWPKRGVFYVKPVVPIGNITPVVTGKAQIGVFFQDAYIKYKHHRAFGMYMLFKPNLVIADPDLIRVVLTKEFNSFHDRGFYWNQKIDPLSDNLVFMPGKRWRNMRAKMTPTFTLGKIKQMFTVLKESGEELTKYLESKTHIKDGIEIKDIFGRYSTDAIMSVAFGIKSNCIEEPNNEYRTQGKNFFDMGSLWIALFAFAPQVMDFLSIPITDRQVTKFYMNVFRESVEQRQAHNIVRHDFMNLLIQLMTRGYVDPDDGKQITKNSSAINKLTMEEATAQGFVFFAAGFETTATTATFALYELAQHQYIQDKVYKEINEMVTKHGSLSYDALNEMTYLHKVVNETMRKYPPFPMLNRICTEELVLPTTNIRVPKGTQITIPVLGLHRDPAIYPDPDKFDPERFNADKVQERHPYTYLPFGEGPRHCIGSRFGYVSTKVGLVNLLSKFKFKLHSQTQVPPIFDEKSIALSAKSGVYLIIESR